MNKSQMNAYTKGIKQGIMTSVDNATNRDKLLQDGQKSMLDFVMRAPENIRASDVRKDDTYGVARAMDEVPNP